MQVTVRTGKRPVVLPLHADATLLHEDRVAGMQRSYNRRVEMTKVESRARSEKEVAPFDTVSKRWS